MKKYSVKIIAIALLYTSLVVGEAGAPSVTSSVVAPTARQTKIAVIDPQKIMMESEEYRDKFSEMQIEFQKRSMDLNKQAEDLNKKTRAASAPNAAAPEREMLKDLAKQQKDIEIEGTSMQQEFNERHGKLQADLAKRVDDAIEVVAKDKWDAVFPKFFYASKDIDITNVVSEQLNKEYKKSKAASKFKKESKEAGTAGTTSTAKV